MKVLVNGGVNLSTLDGWWAEAYRPELGWALSGDGHDDASDAGQLYELLEREVVPSFYDRDARGIPAAWVARIRASMASLAPTYSANRALREYTERYYLPSATAFEARSRDGAKAAVAIAEWEHHVRTHWSSLRFGDARVITEAGRHRIETSVYLNELDPGSVSVELYADGQGGADAIRVPMRREAPLIGAHGFVYAAEVADTRPAWHFTRRLIASHAGVVAPLEMPLIAWAK